MKDLKGKNFIVYYRVSTQRQGRSGLGLEAQRSMCNTYLQGIPNYKVIGEYTDVESGKKNNRPQLLEAINECKKNKATLLIAKLDRLSREVEFIFNLRNSGINFICSDMPDFNTLTLGIFATIAQYERELTSERTKAALAEKKKQGFKLGNSKNLLGNFPVAMENSIATRKQMKLDNENNKQSAALIILLRDGGMKWDDIIVELNNKGFKASKGGNIDVTQARRLYKYFK